MTAVEAAGRAVCTLLAAHPDTWQGFEAAIRAGLNAAIDTLPPDLAEAVRAYLSTEATP